MTAANLTVELLAKGPFARPAAPYTLIEVTGPDAGDFLQRLCSQDVLGLPEARTAPAAFLDGKGKLLATCLVFRLPGAFWLECRTELADRLLALLERYHFTEKLAFARRDLGPCGELVWRSCNDVAQDHRVVLDGARLSLKVARNGVSFLRVHGGEAGIVGLRDDGGLEAAPVQPLTEARAEALRMAAGFVRTGVETEANTLALEAALDDHCSSTKGCYTGQEIVARIHTYGHVNRRLCLLRLPDGPPIDAPQPLHEPEDRLAVGRVLHAVVVPELALRAGLGYLPKDFQAPGTELVLADGGLVRVEPWGR